MTVVQRVLGLAIVVLLEQIRMSLHGIHEVLASRSDTSRIIWYSRARDPKIIRKMVFGW